MAYLQRFTRCAERPSRASARVGRHQPSQILNVVSPNKGHNLHMKPLITFVAIVVACIACSPARQRGIADRRSEFRKFLPMTADPAKDGLKEVRPYFTTANRADILRVIQRACQGHRAGSAVFDPEKKAGYYVNCNPENRQLLNGFVPLNPSVRPRSR
jgi:hypothetical protein